jgi:hypothetical protein
VKLIKFDLPLDGARIKSLDELREHFSAEILGHCRSGLLLRWLRSRGLATQAAALDELDTSQDEPLFRGLCKIFEIEIDELILSAMFNTTQAAPAGTSAKQVEATYGQMIAEIDSALEKVIRERTPQNSETVFEHNSENRSQRLAYLRGLEHEISNSLIKGLLKRRADELDRQIKSSQPFSVIAEMVAEMASKKNLWW